jgi:hypothetical protein
MYESDPILFAALRAAIAFADLDRELQRRIISPHGTLKDHDGRKTEDVRRA